MSNALNSIFKARSIAIIGASNDPSKRGNQAIRKLRADGYEGRIYPINPKAPEILGLKAYASVMEVEGEIDVVLVCTPAKTLPSILEQCGQENIPGAVVLAAGFSEIGAEGEAISLVCTEELDYLKDIEKLVDLKIPKDTIEGFEPDPDEPTTPPKRGQNRSRGRQSKSSNSRKRSQHSNTNQRSQSRRHRNSRR